MSAMGSTFFQLMLCVMLSWMTPYQWYADAGIALTIAVVAAWIESV